jgi:hypothetical protein
VSVSSGTIRGGDKTYGVLIVREAAGGATVGVGVVVWARARVAERTENAAAASLMVGERKGRRATAEAKMWWRST